MSNNLFPRFIKISKNRIMNTKHIFSMGIFSKDNAGFFQNVETPTYARIKYFDYDGTKGSFTANEGDEMYKSVQKCIGLCENEETIKNIPKQKKQKSSIIKSTDKKKGKELKQQQLKESFMPKSQVVKEDPLKYKKFKYNPH